MANLRPFEDLIKEIEHKGEKFIPIIEIAKIGVGSPELVGNIPLIDNINRATIMIHFNSNGIQCFLYINYKYSINISIGNDYFPVKDQVQIFKLLIEWGFISLDV